MKKTSKKASAKKTAVKKAPKKTSNKMSIKRTSKKIATDIKNKALQVKRTSKKIADDVLLKMGPSLQSQVEKLNKQIKAQSEAMQDFKVMGLKVLEKAKAMSEALKKNPTAKKPKTSKKKNG